MILHSFFIFNNLIIFFFFVDSLAHRAAVAEMMFVLEPNKKKEAINLIVESPKDLVSPYVS